MDINRLVRWIFAAAIVALVLIVAYLANPYQPCGNFAGSGLPRGAGELFVTRIMDAWLQDDFQLLQEVSSDDAYERLLGLEKPAEESYQVVNGDALAGHSKFRGEFVSGTILRVDIFGQWHTCPDFSVTEQELLANIELIWIASEGER